MGKIEHFSVITSVCSSSSILHKKKHNVLIWFDLLPLKQQVIGSNLGSHLMSFSEFNLKFTLSCSEKENHREKNCTHVQSNVWEISNPYWARVTTTVQALSSWDEAFVQKYVPMYIGCFTINTYATTTLSHCNISARTRPRLNIMIVIAIFCRL